jgi:hypothetical protein
MGTAVIAEGVETEGVDGPVNDQTTYGTSIFVERLYGG